MVRTLAVTEGDAFTDPDAVTEGDAFTDPDGFTELADGFRRPLDRSY